MQTYSHCLHLLCNTFTYLIHTPLTTHNTHSSTATHSHSTHNTHSSTATHTPLTTHNTLQHCYTPSLSGSNSQTMRSIQPCLCSASSRWRTCVGGTIYQNSQNLWTRWVLKHFPTAQHSTTLRISLCIPTHSPSANSYCSNVLASTPIVFRGHSILLQMYLITLQMYLITLQIYLISCKCT